MSKTYSAEDEAFNTFAAWLALGGFDRTKPSQHDHHFHKCRACSRIWDHRTSEVELGTEGQFDQAHTCPECGEQGCVWKFYTRDEAEKGRAR